MSIATPPWNALQLTGQPMYTPIPDVPASWQRVPLLAASAGYGFGQGGFGQGGFGGGTQQTGVSQPVWTAWTTD